VAECVHDPARACACVCHGQSVILHDHACCAACPACGFRDVCAYCVPRTHYLHGFVDGACTYCRGATPDASCLVCDGGLRICRVCGGAEATLTRECPGRPMTAAEQDAVQAGTLRFEENRWRLPPTSHDLLTALNCDCGRTEFCFMCDSGAVMCRTCQGSRFQGASSLPTDCPGRPFPLHMRDVRQGFADFRGDAWKFFPVAFVSGHRDLTEAEFATHYEPALAAHLQREGVFVVGDCTGADTLAQRWLAARRARFVVYHMLHTPRYSEPWAPLEGGFASDEARDAAMTARSTIDIAWVRPGRERSGTARNLARRKRGPA